MKKLLFAIFFLLGWSTAYVQNIAYIRSWEVTRPGIKNIEDVSQLAPGDANMSTQYIDGMGRTFQTVRRMASPDKKDFVMPVQFDFLGREAKSLLPYVANSNNGSFQSNSIADQQAFFSNLYPGEARFFQETIYDQTGLGRVIGSQRPGNSWNAGGGKKEQYIQSFSGKKHIWTIGSAASALPVTSATSLYPEQSLWLSGISDEHMTSKFTYTDFSGKKILERIQKTDNPIENAWEDWASTYYVYDDFDRLRYIITPKAVEWLSSHNWNLTQEIADELCYKYVYDDRGKQISKKQPGAEEIEYVYDARGRIVFSRDGTDRSKNKWMAVLYDDLDRVVLKGYIITNVYNTRSALQDYVYQQAMTPAAVNGQMANNSGIIKNLELNNREVGRSWYIAGKEITMLPGFETEQDAVFTAEIQQSLPQSSNFQASVLGNPIPNADASLITLTRFYYDDYSFESAQNFNSNYQFPSINNPNLLEVRKSERVLDKITGLQSRVVEGENEQMAASFLPATYYYNNDGYLLQSIGGNYLGGTDISTNLYDYSGLLLANSLIQNVPNTSITNFHTGTLYEYDVNGKLLSHSKSYAGQPYKKLRTFSYDNLRNLKTETIAPEANNGQGLETLTYDYALQGWNKGVNSSFVTTTAKSDQWNHYFGEVLGFDNQDGLFEKPRYNGSLTGSIWKSQGDNIQRKYNYDYTIPGQLSKADFTQNEELSSAGWNKNKMDASVPLVSYDVNGNISNLQQKGLLPGQNTSALIDDLSYQYKNGGLSNRLISVNDQAAIGNLNGIVGDFKNKDNTPSVQYAYDASGKLITDFNKDIRDGENPGIFYNALNKPRRVIIEGKCELNYVYDSEGRLLAKQVIKKDVNPNKELWQYYVNGIMFFNQTPQYISHEGGRLRISQVKSSEANTTPSLQLGGNNNIIIDGRPAFFDYFISDHQGSIRAVLTEEEHVEGHLATMEVQDPVRKSYEEVMFGKVNEAGQPTSGNELVATRIDMPAAWTSHYQDQSNKKASKLSQQNPIGPNMLLKVMAGDLVNLRVEYFFNETPSSGGSSLSNIANSILSAFTASAPAVEAGAKEVATHLESQFTNASGPLASYLLNPDREASVDNLPGAYLNWIFFDENFNLITYNPQTGLGSGARRVEGPGDNRSLIKTDIKAPVNGYAFLYVSNISNINVWFDNLSITHNRSRLLYENHYYPYGLEIAGISSKAYGKLENYFRYQGAYSEFEEETGWNKFDLRNYDPQLGRWTSIDPYDEFSSGYVGMGGDPVNFVDPTGGAAEGAFGATANNLAGVTVKSAIKLNSFSLFQQSVLAAMPQGFYDWIRNRHTRSIQHTGQLPNETLMSAEFNANYEYLGEEGVFEVDEETGEGWMFTKSGGYYKGIRQLEGVVVKSGKSKVLAPATGLKAVTPVLGSSIDAISNFQQGKWGWGLFHTALAISDVILVKSIITSIGKIAIKQISKEVAEEGMKGGLNLFKFGQTTTTTTEGWREGDRMLKMFDQGGPKLNWKQNSGFLRREMRAGNPIFDSYRYANGQQIPTGGFLKAERYLLESRGWVYNPITGAYHPPL